MSRVEGRNLLIFVRDSAWNYKLVAASVSCEYDESVSLMETNGGQWKKYVKSMTAWKVSTQHLITIDNAVNLSQLQDKEVMVRFATSSDSKLPRNPDTTTFTHTLNKRGMAICARATVNARMGQKVSGNFEFYGNGWNTSLEQSCAFMNGYVWEEDYIDESAPIKENI